MRTKHITGLIAKINQLLKQKGYTYDFIKNNNKYCVNLKLQNSDDGAPLTSAVTHTIIQSKRVYECFNLLTEYLLQVNRFTDLVFDYTKSLEV